MIDRDEIIKLAREAGLLPNPEVYAEDLEHFAALVAAAEREACAQVRDDTQRHCSTLAARSMLMEAAAAIRARSQA